MQTAAGSPPPMRGKVVVGSHKSSTSRITPAYAGKSAYASAFSLCLSGSPPPMRGKECVAILTALLRRITPAYAGKRDWHVHEAARPKDHPRLCGEKLAGGGQGNFWTGSPPPMRGKDTELVGMLAGGGITPAYAGKRSIITV